MPTTTRGSAFVLLGAILATMTGCAALQAASGEPITSVDQIVGKWAGTITPGHDSVREPFYLTITPEGRLVAEWGVDTSWGTVTLRNGQATFEMKPPIAQGSIRLYVDSGKRTLVMAGVVPSFLAEMTPQRLASPQPEADDLISSGELRAHPKGPGRQSTQFSEGQGA